MPVHVGLTYNLKQDAPDRERAKDWTAEYESPETIERIVAALQAGGHAVTRFPFSPDLVDRLAAARPELVFNIAEGWHGRNRESLVPAICEFLELPFTGSDALSLGLALDKAMAKRVVAAANVPTPPMWLIADPVQLGYSPITFPAFVKPNAEGSSKGVRAKSRVETPEQLAERVHWVLETYRQPALVETFLPGREFTVGVLGNQVLEALPIIEVQAEEDLGDPFVYSYETKAENRERFSCPALLDDETERGLIAIAFGAFRALDCRDVGRVDVRMDALGHPYFLEINPLPGLSAQSLLPMQAAAAGIDFAGLVLRILEHARARYGL
ncbi:MAG TPA: D-alanine--D-alanine ligase [Limnochordia bacterium]|nr:D-alanine--D-alanine ligase [Limnochordia bacterium]